MTSIETQLLSSCRFCAIDFESAGAARGRTDAPVQIGLACGGLDASCDDGGFFVSYLKSDQPIRWSAQRVHGIRADDLKDAPPLAMLWPEIKQRMQRAVIVAHGKGTEKRFLRAFPGHGFGPWVDTLLLARAVWPDMGGHALGEVCDALGLTPQIRALVPGKSWHDALFDAVASLVLLRNVIDTHGLRDAPACHLFSPDHSRWRALKR